jgi:hypothetical protein
VKPKIKVGDAVVVAGRVVSTDGEFVGVSLLDANDIPRVTDLTFSIAGVHPAPKGLSIRNLTANEIDAAKRSLREE